MTLDDRAEELQATLRAIRERLKEIAPARARRRADEVRDERDETEARKVDLLELQEQAHDDLEHLENALQKLIDLGDDGTSEEALALVAEIDLLERELDRREPKIAKLRKKDKRQTERYRKLDAKADRRKKRAGKLEARKKHVLARLEEVVEAIKDRTDWPADLVVAELLYHSPPHCHLASPERAKLITIGRIAVDLGLRVGEFPPFDVTENVHTSGSWHYRNPANPWTPVAFNASMMRLGGPWGCAMDLNDADGGSDKEVAFYHELVRRYG